MQPNRWYAKAALLRDGDAVLDWRGTRYVERSVGRVELTAGRLGGRVGAYPECTVRVYEPDAAAPFYTGPASRILRVGKAGR